MIRQSGDRLTFLMEVPYWKGRLYIEKGSWVLLDRCFQHSTCLLYWNTTPCIEAFNVSYLFKYVMLQYSELHHFQTARKSVFIWFVILIYNPVSWQASSFGRDISKSVRVVLVLGNSTVPAMTKIWFGLMYGRCVHHQTDMAHKIRRRI